MAQALYDEHPIQDYLRVEVREEVEAGVELMPGSHPTLDRALFIEELPSVDLRWLAPVFEKISSTVREENRKRRNGEAFAEVFKWRLVSSALLAVSSGEGVTTGPTTFGTKESAMSLIDAVEVSLDSAVVIPQPNGLPGNFALPDEEDERFYDAQSTMQPPFEECVELPPVPILSTVLLVVLRYPHILLLLVALLIPFWSTYLVEGRLRGLLLQSESHNKMDSTEAEVPYEETLSTLDDLISYYNIWEQMTQHAIAYISSSQYASYADSPSPSQSEFLPHPTQSPPTASLSELLAKSLQTTGSHTTTIRSLLSALQRSPREMRMLERMYAPASPSVVPTLSLSLRRAGSSRSATTISTLEEEQKEEKEMEEELIDDEDVLNARLTPSTPRTRGKRPLSLSPTSPSISLTYHSPASSVSRPSSRLFHSPTPPRAYSPPLQTPQINRPQSLFLTPSETVTGSSPHRVPYSTSTSLSDIHSHAHTQHPAVSPTSRSPAISASVRSLPASPLTKFTTLPSRVSPLGNGAIRGRRKSLSSLRPWSVCPSESCPNPNPHTPSRPSTSLPMATTALESVPLEQQHHSHYTSFSRSQSHTRSTLHDFEPLIITTSELLELKKEAKAEIRHTAGCLLGLRFLSPESTRCSHVEKNKFSLTQFWEKFERSFLSSVPSKLSFLAPPEPKRKPSDESIIREDEEEEGDDALDAEIAYDPAYWEDVRSVLGLFKTALEDGVEKLKENFPPSAFPPPPSPPIVAAASPLDSDASYSTILTPASAQPATNATLGLAEVRQEIGRTNELLLFLKEGKAGRGMDAGFAPMPSQLARFGGHMEAVQDALTEAQIALRECVQLLISSPTSITSSVRDQEAGYDRLRAALGVALRECERSRAPLMEHLHPSRSRFGLGLDDTIPEEDSDHLRESMPPLVHDDQDDNERSSTESVAISPPPHASDSLATIVEENPSSDRDANAPTLQQLLEQALISIPEGSEQVFEGEPETQPGYDRKRPTLSRDERIKQAKERRANNENPLNPAKDEKKRKSFRPGLDVIQELKDAIWHVGERRRRSGRTSGGPATVTNTS